MLKPERARLIIDEILCDLRKEYDEDVTYITRDDGYYALSIDGWKMLETYGVVEFEQKMEDFCLGIFTYKYGVEKAQRKIINRIKRI